MDLELSCLSGGSRARQRRFLYKGHIYEYRSVESRPKPRYRDDDFVKEAVALATRAQPFCGHKTVVPCLAMWPGWSWRRTIPPEPMHDVKNTCDNLMTLLVGKKSEAGKYSNWGKDVAHRRHCKLLGIFRDLWPPDRPPPGAAANPDPPDPEPEPAPFPWRLTPAQIKVLSARTKNIMWPHHMERMFYRGYSMWEKPSRMWKCRRKFRLLLFVLPVQLRDQVPPLRDALTLFAWTLRRLDGQVYSYATATVMGILPGSHVLTRGQTKRLHKDLIRSLVLLEGCVPVGHLIPTWHHFVHYAEFTETHGVLRWLWMMAFERLVCLLTHCYYCLVSSYVHNNHA